MSPPAELTASGARAPAQPGERTTSDGRPHFSTPEQLRQALDAAPTGMVVADREGRIVLVNAQAARLFGYTQQELLGQTVDTLVPLRFRGRQTGFWAAVPEAQSSRPSAGAELFGLRKDGSELPLEIGLHALSTGAEQFVVGSVVDVSERRRDARERGQLVNALTTLNAELEQRVQRRTAELVEAIKERDVLLREVHHRVKNNLQVISSLMSVQAAALDGASRAAFDDCRARVQAIALIHEALYQPGNYAFVPFSPYVRALAASVFQAVRTSPEHVTLQLEVEDVSLAIDKAMPCGLILNELITNSLKHAFPGGRAGTVRVELAREPAGGLRLVVADDGVGLPPGVDIEHSLSLGLHLVRMLTKQLGAKLYKDETTGTTLRLLVPEEA